MFPEPVLPFPIQWVLESFPHGASQKGESYGRKKVGMEKQIHTFNFVIVLFF